MWASTTDVQSARRARARAAGGPAAKIQRRREINARYRETLADLPGLAFIPIADDGEPNHWLTCLTINPAEAHADRDTVIKHLAHASIEPRPGWKPMHRQRLYAMAKVIGGATANDLFATSLCLPSGSSLTDADVDRVVQVASGALT